MKLDDVTGTFCSCCGSKRLLFAIGGCDDTFVMYYKDQEFCGYPPELPFTDGNDQFELVVCLDCMTLQSPRGEITEAEIQEMFNQDDD